jgi:hypothetical protein
LYAIPLPEIKDVRVKEALMYPHQRKSQALHFLEIELKESYGTIAASIAQLYIGKLGGRSDSPLKDPGNTKALKANKTGKVSIAHQNHSYEDEVLVFVAQSKKTVSDWLKRLRFLVFKEGPSNLNTE